ncbi:MAG: metal-sulfur cluster assembly factor [Oligoflexia bacterium]|nr:metal-sulfur cluster assembly factor [Oligoflexia bacterium]
MIDQPQLLSKEEWLEWLMPVEDPELFMPLVDLGLIYNVAQEGSSVSVTMTLTSPGCPAAGYLVEEVKKRILEHKSAESVSVDVVFEPKWDPSTMASDEVKDKLGIW